MATRGFILYRGPSFLGHGNIVVIATLKTENPKTGNMVQVWILPDNGKPPLESVQLNENAAACGTCPLQGVADGNGKMSQRVCYVNLGQAPAKVWNAYIQGRYSMYSRSTHEHLLRHRSIRIGAYGDPAALPLSLVRYLAKVGSGWTGYSHQLFWIDQRRAKALARYLMVSCHTPAMHAEAKRRGWRAFTVVSKPSQAPAGAIECPNTTRGITCEQCQLCRGTNRRAKDIYILAHAKVGLNLPAIQAIGASK